MYITYRCVGRLYRPKATLFIYNRSCREGDCDFTTKPLATIYKQRRVETKMSRLVDYFVVSGLHNESLEKELTTGEH